MPPPLARGTVLDLYFLEHRAKLLDLAAFLDRLDRATVGAPDFRETAFRDALKILSEAEPSRARRILERLSDPTLEVPESAHGTKGATGAYARRGQGGAS